jgi:hypothetical protein
MRRHRKDKSRPSSKSSSVQPKRLRPPSHDFARPTQDLFGPWAVGVVLAVLGLGIAAGWVKKGAEWGMGPDGAAPDCAAGPVCQLQRCRRDAELASVDAAIDRSKQRLDDLESALTDKSSPAFALARQAIDREGKEKRRLATRKAALLAEGTHKGVELGVALFLSLLSFAAGQLLVRAARGLKSLRWDRRSYTWAGGVAAAVFLGHVVSELVTSVFATHKSLFGWHSFCVSPVSWGFAQVAALGISLTLVYPLAIAFALGDASARREPELDHPDGDCGVGGYVKLAKWVGVVGLSAVVVGAVVGLDVVLLARRALNPLSLLVPAIVLGAAVWALVRVGANVLWIRSRYRAKQWEFTLAGDPKPRAPDPTCGFFLLVVGMPALIFLVVAVKWMVVRHLGIMGPALDHMLVGLLG